MGLSVAPSVSSRRASLPAALNLWDEATRILVSRSVVATSSVIACGQDVSPARVSAVLDEAGISRGVHFCTPGK